MVKVNSDICKEIMHRENLTCVIADSEKIIYKSDRKGILPMLEILDLYEKEDYKPLYQADRIIGKAAVIISTHCGIKEIYSDVISQAAYDIAVRNDITVCYDQLVEMILDPSRKKEGPFEAALHDVDENDFEKVLQIIHETLLKVQNRQKDTE